MPHEPADTTCHSPGCGQPMQRFGEDVAERLDYQPGVFSVERHVRGKFELRRHAVLHADETPVSMLKPAHLRDGKTHRAYIWSYYTTSLNATKAVVFEFCETRSGENVREFLQLGTSKAWQGTLVTDGFSGYTATTTQGVTSAQCMAHARRKFMSHQGSRLGVASAPLAVWTHDSATVAVADMAADITAHSAPQELAPAATLATATTCWTCRRCGQRQPTALRLGFVRHGVPQRRRHDHSP